MKRFQKIVTIIAVAAGCAAARAQEVRATLTQDTIVVRQPVQLTLSVNGSANADVPAQLNIDGLDARATGKQVRVEMQNFKFKSFVDCTYLIIPSRAGDFTIPPISVRVNGKMLKTEPLILHVQEGNGVPVPQTAPPPQGGFPGVPQPQPQPQQLSEEQITFGEMVVPRKTAYVGEVVPLELRFYIDASVPVQQLADKPVFGGDGFTVLRLSKPIVRQQDIKGRTYNVITFQTAITAVKSGTLEIPQATFDMQLRMPMANRNEDFFGLFGGVELRDATSKSNGAKLEIKSLPTDGRPEDFAGAIGQFSLQATAAPKKAGPGDPISLNVTVAGHGNFEAMGAPILSEADGWQSYPPSEKFEPSSTDPIGYNGNKNYQFMIVAREDRTKTPGVRFSYFDPALGQYVGLSVKPINVEAQGIGAPAPVVAVASATPQASATPAVAITAKPASILMTDFHPTNFHPFAFGRVFLVANGVVAAVWLGFLAFGIGRTVVGSALMRHSASRREHKKMLHQIEDPDLNSEQFLDRAAQFVRVRLGCEDNPAGARDAVERAAITDTTKTHLRDVLEQYDESRYSSSGFAARLGAEQRRTIVNHLKTFDEELQ